MKLLKIALWLGFGILVATVLYKFYRCRQKGDESGKAFRCSLFSSEPTMLLALKNYTDMVQGKCYEIVDYGNSMSYRKVELESCGERNPVMKSESLAEYETID